MFDEFGRDVVGQLPRRFRLPVGIQALRIERRKLFLDLVREMEIQGLLCASVEFAQDRGGLTRIVIAVVKEENDLATDLALKPASGGDFRVEKPFRKKAARLLTEADDRGAHRAGARSGSRNNVVCKIQAKSNTAAQPIRLYQR